MAANSQIEMLGNRTDFDHSRDVTDYVLVLTRLITGYWFLRAGVTKIASELFSAVGYLVNAPAAPPLQGFFAWATTTPWFLDPMDVMVPWDKFLIGLGLIVGALVQLAVFFGGVLMVFSYLGNAEWSHGAVNGGLSGLMMFVIVSTLTAGRILGLGVIVEKTEFAHQRPALKYFLG